MVSIINGDEIANYRIAKPVNLTIHVFASAL